jgi:hypothetical protein
MLIDKLKEVLGMKSSRFKNIEGEVNGNIWAEATMTNRLGNPIGLGTSIGEVDTRVYLFVSGAKCAQVSRVDNNHGFLHEHPGSSRIRIPLQGATVSCALIKVLGINQYNQLEDWLRQTNGMA